jgi:hypothetical protein
MHTVAAAHRSAETAVAFRPRAAAEPLSNYALRSAVEPIGSLADAHRSAAAVATSLGDHAESIRSFAVIAESPSTSDASAAARMP